MIPRREQANGKYPPSARGFGRETYGRRNVLERLIGRVKEYRRLATRCDKLADSFRCSILLGFIRTWLRDLLPYRA